MVKYLALLFAAAISLSSVAAPISVKVTARDGSPVEHAVVSSGGPVKASQELAVMDQVNKMFSPYVLAVGQGASVEFPNSDQIRHHVYSFSEAKPFEIRLYSGVPEVPIMFDQPGVVVVGCNIHDNMVGYIFVSPREHWAITDTTGTAQLGSAGEDIFVWFPSLSLNAQQEQRFSVDALPESDGVIEIRLDIEPPPAHPQAVRTTDRDRFKRYLD